MGLDFKGGEGGGNFWKTGSHVPKIMQNSDLQSCLVSVSCTKLVVGPAVDFSVMLMYSEPTIFPGILGSGLPSLECMEYVYPEYQLKTGQRATTSVIMCTLLAKFSVYQILDTCGPWTKDG